MGDSVVESVAEPIESAAEIIAESIDYTGQFAQVTSCINETNEFIYALIDRIDFFIALMLAVVISAVVYIIIKSFTRF